MPEVLLPSDAQGAVKSIGQADIVIGIPSYNNVRTIRHVVQAAHAGLSKYFPQFSSLVINSDGGSKDGTREAVLSTRVEDTYLLLLSTPLFPAHRLCPLGRRRDPGTQPGVGPGQSRVGPALPPGKKLAG